MVPVNQNPVTIATFQFLHEADLAKMFLEEKGLTVFLADAEIVNTDWLLGNAVQGIKLQVPGDQVEAGRALLEEIKNESNQMGANGLNQEGNLCLACGTDMGQDSIRCPACGWSFEKSED